jgi:hypothetical protein
VILTPTTYKETNTYKGLQRKGVCPQHGHKEEQEIKRFAQDIDQRRPQCDFRGTPLNNGTKTQRITGIRAEETGRKGITKIIYKKTPHIRILTFLNFIRFEQF